MDAKDFCNCEHAQTLLEFIQVALANLYCEDYKEAIDTLELARKIHNKAKVDYYFEFEAGKIR